MAARYVPQRGALVWLESSPQAGHEQAGLRPALVLSPKAYNAKTGLCLVCPIAGQRKGYPFEAALPSGIKTTGMSLADHPKSLDWKARRAARIEGAPQEVIDEALQNSWRF